MAFPLFLSLANLPNSFAKPQGGATDGEAAGRSHGWRSRRAEPRMAKPQGGATDGGAAQRHGRRLGG